VATELGLRERKKQQTRHNLLVAALRLFLERGFDNVSVAEIAAEAEVSKMTVFNYFPTKEDIVLHPMEEHVDELARIVSNRRPGESAVAALRRHFLAGLAERDPITGLNDATHIREFRKIMLETPALFRYVLVFRSRRETHLAEALARETLAGPDDITPRIAANQIAGALDGLVIENSRRLVEGQSADEVYAFAVKAAERAFDLLEHGLGDYCAADPASARG
jgi:AcrR family transcriptional regulator